MAGRRPSGHALQIKAGGKGKRPPPARDQGSKRRPAAGSESDASDESPMARRKKKKRKKAPVPEAPSKLQLLPPRRWEGVRLPPMVREIRPADAGGPIVEADVEAVRRRLQLRVPAQRRRPCSFWLKGECRRGSACAFLHASADDAPASPPLADCPPPVLSLGDPSLPRLIGRAMLGLGLRAPSAVQAQAWPVALAGRDLLCRAPTGSGKTLAYLLPALAHMAAQPRPPRPGAGPQVLVLVPTRELAVQTLSVARGVRRAAGGAAAAPVAVYGGGPRDEQLAALEGRVGLCIATTGRLLDLLGERAVVLGQVTMLVLDEADALLALGFEAQVSAICGQVRPDRQSLLFSATFPPNLEQAAAAWLTDPVRIYAAADAGAPPVAGEAGYREGAGGAGPAADGNGGDGAGEQGAEGEGVAAAGEDSGDDWAPVPPPGISGGVPPGISADAPLGFSADAPLGISSIPASVEERFLLCEGGQRRQALLEVLAGLGLAGRRGMGGVGVNGPGVNGTGVNGEGVNRAGESVGMRGGQGTGRGQSQGGSTTPNSGAPGRGGSRRPAARVLVFVSEVKALRGLASCLRRHGVSARVLHGSLDQRDREEALLHFRSGAASVLLATDVAARGVHVPRLEAVVNFDLPPTPAQYVHRAGRTGRHGAPGLAVTLMRPGAQAEAFARGVAAMRSGVGLPVPLVLLQLAGGRATGAEVGVGTAAAAAAVQAPAAEAATGGVVGPGLASGRGGMQRAGHFRSARGEAGGAAAGAAGATASTPEAQRVGGGGAGLGGASLGGSLADFAAAFG